jgi:hypothetical protein
MSTHYTDGRQYAEGSRRRMGSYAEGNSTPTATLAGVLEAPYTDGTDIWPSP